MAIAIRNPAVAFQMSTLTRSVAQRWFLAGGAVVWVHLLDASVVHPQRGAGLLEHSAQAVAAIAAGPLSLAVFQRSGRLLRGTLAFLLGLAATAPGIAIHGVGVFKNGFEPADATGLALVPAGLLLIVLGVVLVVLSVPRIRYRLLLAPAVVPLFLFFVAPVLLGTYASHAPRYEIGAGDMGAPYEAVSFETADGLTLRGWYVPSRNGAAVMVLHGSGGARIRVMEHARMLVAEGYGVLAFDVRGHGESDGVTNAFGWGAHPDVFAAAEFLEARDDVDRGRIGVLGLSMGAEVALDAASRGAPLAAIIADGAGVRSFNEALSRKRTLSTALELPTYFLVGLVTTVLSETTAPPALEDGIPEITAPTLLISSTVAEERELNRIWFEKLNALSEHWEVDAGHTAGLREYPEEYRARALRFLAENLLGAP